MSEKNQHHVVPNPQQGGWDVKVNNSDRSIKHFQTKQPAIDFARQKSKDQRTELVIHGKNGKIQSKDSHGNDPYPPKDK
jgi:ribosome-associated translation inhibitor RaiA